MSEYPIPLGAHYHSCILRGSYKSAFLHPKEETQGLMSKMLIKIVSPPPIRGKRTSYLRKPTNPWPMKKPTPPRIKKSIKTPAFT
jgi:hypothetical protein